MQIYAPRITGKSITSAGLLLHVKRAVLEEPRRANLNDWVTLIHGENARTRPYGFPVSAEMTPPCGTIGCIAGNCIIHLRPTDDFTVTSHIAKKLISALDQLIGYKNEDGNLTTGTLFSSLPEKSFGECDYDPNGHQMGFYSYGRERKLGTPGSQQHAQTIARRIDIYVGQHRELFDRDLDLDKIRADWFHNLLSP